MSTPQAPATTPPTPAASKGKASGGHLLPGWLLWVYRHVTPVVLLAAEAFLLGRFFSHYLESDANAPTVWLPFIGSFSLGVLFPAASWAGGVVCAGATLLFAVNAPVYWKRSQYLFACITTFAACACFLLVVYAGLDARASLPPTRLDAWVESFVTWEPNAPTPTAFAASLALPVVDLFFGVGNMAAYEESEEEKDARHAERLRKERERRELVEERAKTRGTQLKGLVQNAQDALATARASTSEPTEVSAEEEGSLEEQTPTPFAAEPVALEGQTLAALRAPVSQKASRSPRKPANVITWKELADWVASNYGIVVSQKEALALIRSHPDAYALDGKDGHASAPGAPLCAPKAPTLQRARAKWGSKLATAAAGE